MYLTKKGRQQFVFCDMYFEKIQSFDPLSLIWKIFYSYDYH
jgi:hypothetical protein